MPLSRLHPARRLRARIALLVVLAVSALAVLMATQSRARLAQAYDDAGRTTLQGIAATFDDGFSSADLRDPAALQQRMTRLKEEVPELHKVSLSWAAVGGGTMLVQAGHEHDPDGTKRDVTTARVIRTAGKTPAPFDAPDYRYAKLRAAQAHFARLERPIGTAASGGPLAVLELHYDLATLDVASQREQRTIAAIAVLGAITVSLLLAFLLTNAVVMPVDRIRAAVNDIRGGDRGRRLNWRRSDELGDRHHDGIGEQEGEQQRHGDRAEDRDRGDGALLALARHVERREVVVVHAASGPPLAAVPIRRSRRAKWACAARSLP